LKPSIETCFYPIFATDAINEINESDGLTLAFVEIAGLQFESVQGEQSKLVCFDGTSRPSD
jgi:hypothetical protein